MTDTTATPVTQDSTKSSLEDMLGLYDRLLREYVVAARSSPFSPYQPILLLLLKSFNPVFQWRSFWYTIRCHRNPNILNQDLLAGDMLLSRLAALDRPALDALAECNRINLDRMVRKSVFGWFTKLATGVVAVVGGAKAVQEVFGQSIRLPPVVGVILVSGVVGLVIGAALNLVIYQPRIGVVRAFGDVVAIARVYRTALESKSSSFSREQGAGKEPPNNQMQRTSPAQMMEPRR